MGALGGHGHAHEHKDELQELLAHPEELTFEFELLVSFFLNSSFTIEIFDKKIFIP